MTDLEIALRLKEAALAGRIEVVTFTRLIDLLDHEGVSESEFGEVVRWRKQCIMHTVSQVLPDSGLYSVGFEWGEELLNAKKDSIRGDEPPRYKKISLFIAVAPTVTAKRFQK